MTPTRHRHRRQMETDQFGAGRTAFLFKPGTYDVDVNVGYYTQVSGLGLSPDDVHVLVGAQNAPAKGVAAERAFQVPNTPNVRFRNMVTVSLGGTSTIRHVINDGGVPSNSATNVAQLVAYP